jgi:hypothetical protein
VVAGTFAVAFEAVVVCRVVVARVVAAAITARFVAVSGGGHTPDVALAVTVVFTAVVAAPVKVMR